MSGKDSSIWDLHFSRIKKCRWRNVEQQGWLWAFLEWQSRDHPDHSSCLLCWCSWALADIPSILREGKGTWFSSLCPRYHKFQLGNVSQKMYWQYSNVGPMMRLFSYKPRFYSQASSFWYNWLLSFISPEGNRKSVSTEDLIGQTFGKSLLGSGPFKTGFI